MISFEGKVALVTGASAGIGRATALAFAKEGARVVAAARREKEGRETVALIREQGGKALFVPADVSRSDDVAAMVAATLREFGRLDCAFNNAGTLGSPKPLIEETEQDFDSVFATNVKGALLCMKHEIPAMLRTGGGAIVNAASIVGHVGIAGLSVYGASKHAIIGLTKAAALEQAKSGIRVNVVSPGAVQTDQFEQATGGSSETKAAFAAMHPIGRVGTPGEIAQAVLFLCSDAASFITGHALGVDGGFTAT